MESTTTGNRPQQRRHTTGSATTEAVAQHLRPDRPADYDLMALYRKGCSNAVRAAESRLEEIDAAWREPKEARPNLFRSGPEAMGAQFGHHADKLTALLQYEQALARWKASRICLRCATTFMALGRAFRRHR